VGGKLVLGKGVGDATAPVGMGVGHSAALIGSFGSFSSSNPRPQPVNPGMRISRIDKLQQSFFIILLSFLCVFKMTADG
jgi:hypothetical protein